MINNALLIAARYFPSFLGGKSCFRKFVRKNRSSSFQLVTKRGFSFEGTIGDNVENQIFVYGDYEPALSDFLINQLNQLKGGNFLDIGCNVGWFTCLAASLKGSTSRVIAIDGNPEMINKCHKNILINNLNADAVCLIVGSNSGYETLYIPEKRHSRASLGYKNAEPYGKVTSVQVKMLPLEEILNFFPNGQCDLIKMDIEGYELKVLKAVSADVIKKIRTIVFEYSPTNILGCGLQQIGIDDLPWLSMFSIQSIDKKGNLREVKSTKSLLKNEDTIILINKTFI